MSQAPAARPVVPEVTQAIPILRIFDLARARDLSEHHGDACPGSTVFVRVRGLREFHNALSAKRYRYMRPGVEPTPWGSLGMEVIDPFGNRLRFDEPRPREER